MRSCTTATGFRPHSSSIQRRNPDSQATISASRPSVLSACLVFPALLPFTLVEKTLKFEGSTRSVCQTDVIGCLASGTKLNQVCHHLKIFTSWKKCFWDYQWNLGGKICHRPQCVVHLSGYNTLLFYCFFSPPAAHCLHSHPIELFAASSVSPLIGYL